MSAVGYSYSLYAPGADCSCRVFQHLQRSLCVLFKIFQFNVSVYRVAGLIAGCCCQAQVLIVVINLGPGRVRPGLQVGTVDSWNFCDVLSVGLTGPLVQFLPKRINVPGHSHDYCSRLLMY